MLATAPARSLSVVALAQRQPEVLERVPELALEPARPTARAPPCSGRWTLLAPEAVGHGAEPQRPQRPVVDGRLARRAAARAPTRRRRTRRATRRPSGSRSGAGYSICSIQSPTLSASAIVSAWNAAWLPNRLVIAPRVLPSCAATALASSRANGPTAIGSRSSSSESLPDLLEHHELAELDVAAARLVLGERRARSAHAAGLYLTRRRCVRTVRIYVRTVRTLNRKARLSSDLRRLPSALPALRRWGITLAATAVSTYALDVVATAAGLRAGRLARSCAASTTLLLLGFLAGTYVAWGAGLRVNLRAPTGRCSSGPGRAPTRSRRPRTTSCGCGRRASARARFAAGAGYVGDRAREGGAVLRRRLRRRRCSPTRSPPSDAMIFLGGANLGAAAYEYGLGAPHARRACDRGYASFETDWVPGEYLADYYSERRAGRASRRSPSSSTRCARPSPASRCSSSASGPTLHHVFLAAPHGVGDPPRRLPAGEPARDRALARARARRPRLAPVRALHARVRGPRAPRPTRRSPSARSSRAPRSRGCSRSTRGDPSPLDERYATVVSAYCADSATDDRATWETYMQHIAGLVRPGGVFITAALRRSPPLRRRRQAVPERRRRRARPARGARAAASSARRSRRASSPSTQRRATRASCSRGRAEGSASRTPSLRRA